MKWWERIRASRRGVAASSLALMLAVALGISPAQAMSTAVSPLTTTLAATAQVTASVSSAQVAGPSSAASKTCSVTKATKTTGLSTLHTIAVNASTGKTLYQKRSSSKIPVASVTKLATAGAAIVSLGEDFRFETTVVRGKKKGQIVLVGGGDVTLASGTKNVYPGAPSVKDLAKQVKNWAKAADVTVTKIVLDTSAMPYATTASSWKSSWRKSGYVSKITALQVDGDRAKPAKLSSKRSNDPVDRAGKAFRKALAKELGVEEKSLKLTDGVAAEDAEQIAIVRSQPLKDLLITVLHHSDNTLAEAIALQVAKKETGKASFSKINTAYRSALKRIGVSTKGLTFRDGSGLSDKSRLTMKFVSKLVLAFDADRLGTGIVLDRLPVAGKSGTLVNRFSTKSTKKARKKVAAKTGTLDGISSLAGVITAKDGSTIVFATAVTDSKKWSGYRQKAIDVLTTRYYTCGSKIGK